MHTYRWLFVFVLLMARVSISAQFLGSDDATSLDEDFIDADSTTHYYLRYSIGYSTISTLRDFRSVVSQTFEKRFGASPIRYSNAIAEGVPIGVSFFKKQNRLFAYGVSAFLSPIIRTSHGEGENIPPMMTPNSTQIASSDAFFQSFSMEAVGECRFKLLLFDFGIGVQTQRIGDKVQTAFYDETRRLIRVENMERRAWIFSPTYFFAIGLDFFDDERFSLVPMYRSFYWHYGNVKGSSDFFLLSLRTNL
jgi:hypothetical protein